MTLLANIDPNLLERYQGCQVETKREETKPVSKSKSAGKRKKSANVKFNRPPSVVSVTTIRKTSPKQAQKKVYSPYKGGHLAQYRELYHGDKPQVQRGLARPPSGTGHRRSAHNFSLIDNVLQNDSMSSLIKY